MKRRVREKWSEHVHMQESGSCRCSPRFYAEIQTKEHFTKVLMHESCFRPYLMKSRTVLENLLHRLLNPRGGNKFYGFQTLDVISLPHRDKAISFTAWLHKLGYCLWKSESILKMKRDTLVLNTQMALMQCKKVRSVIERCC